MLHLVDDIRADFAFTTITLKQPYDKFVYMDDRAFTSTDLNEDGLFEFDGMASAMETFGDLPTMLESLILVTGDLWLMLDNDDMYQLVVSHYRSIYPNMDLETIHVILRCFYLHHRYVRVKGFVHDEHSKQLPLPTTEDSRRYYDAALIGDGYQLDLKKHLGYEVLLANALAVDFDNNDPYVTLFAEKIERMLWISCARDFTKRRMAAFYNGFQLKKTMGLPLDFKQNDIESQFDQPSVKRFFNPSVTYRDVDVIKSDFQYVCKTMRQIDELVGYEDSYRFKLFDLLDPKVPFTGETLKTLVTKDKESLWSFLFGREKLTKDTNGVLVNFLYNAPDETLVKFKLAPVR